jgi:hypothetical protein
MMNYDANEKVTAKVGDFGLARHVDPKLYEALGTWQWLAPGTHDTHTHHRTIAHV